MPVARRDLIAAGVLTAGLGAARWARGAPGPAIDPRSTAEGQVKLEATLDGSPAFWTYDGVIYAVRPGVRPLPILTIAGGQSVWAERRMDGDYIVRGAILTFFRDPTTAVFLETFDNPLTNRRNLVTPNVLSGGGLLYPANGSSATLEGRVKAGVVAPRGFKADDPARALGAVRWNVVGSSIMLMTDRAWNVVAQPQLEAQTQFGDREAFFDLRQRRMSARFSATTIVPWMAWMEMGDAPGHLVWHSSGEKVFTIDEMPKDYKVRAGSKLDLLVTRPS